MTSIKTLCGGMTARQWQWLFFALFVTVMLMMPALADNPQGGNPLNGINIAGNDKKDLNSMFGFFIKLIIVSIPFVILIFAHPFGLLLAGASAA